ncbi:MAG: sce7726 family protein [Clostridiales bacterium]|nr:sce7726 family protein [Clostridiales bacterium]
MKMSILDPGIRDLLFDYLAEKHEKFRFMEEVVIGSSRADVVIVLENELIGCEIKSDADSYARLASQTKNYDKYFDRNMVVVGTSHRAGVREHVPPHWGIFCAAQGGGIELVREAGINKKVKLKNQLSLLWRAELGDIQRLNSMPKYYDKSRRFVIPKILEKAEPETLRRQICAELIERDYTV